jgi:hypothetical protein
MEWLGVKSGQVRCYYGKNAQNRNPKSPGIDNCPEDIDLFDPSFYEL